jgi:hypothetical protein
VYGSARVFNIPYAGAMPVFSAAVVVFIASPARGKRKGAVAPPLFARAAVVPYAV